mmetsp:Transcript_24040/g.69092  ORF Transcript_24040/g.69092 Transcript_24040/m.69092 type:complete len:348 (+) Transcript_24040:384-1427(+)
MVIHPTRGSIPKKRAPSASICRTWSVHQRRLVGPLTRWREEKAWWAQLSHRAPPRPCGPEHQARLDHVERRREGGRRSARQRAARSALDGGDDGGGLALHPRLLARNLAVRVPEPHLLPAQRPPQRRAAVRARGAARDLRRRWRGRSGRRPRLCGAPAMDEPLERLVERELDEGEGQLAGDRHTEPRVEASPAAARKHARQRLAQRAVLPDLHSLRDDRRRRPHQARGGGRRHGRACVLVPEAAAAADAVEGGRDRLVDSDALEPRLGELVHAEKDGAARHRREGRRKHAGEEAAPAARDGKAGRRLQPRLERVERIDGDIDGRRGAAAGDYCEGKRRRTGDLRLVH